VYAAASLVGGAIFVDRAMRRPRHAVGERERQRAEALALAANARLEDVAVTARDGAVLRGWTFIPAAPNGRSIIFLHGIVSNRASMLPVLRLFLERGYRTMTIDARAHGESGGSLITFGALEADDLRRWVSFARSSGDDCVYLFGGSLGATYALAASDAPGLCAVVAVSGYASLREIAFDRIGEQSHTGTWLGRTLLRPGVELGFAYAWLRYGFNLWQASVFPAIERAGPPIFVVQGSADEITPARHASLMQASSPARVTLWLIPGGSHAPATQAGPEYSRRVVAFVEEHRRPYANGM